MKHHQKNRKFGRVTKQRGALLSSLARELTLMDSIKTTEAKAKEVRPFIEKLITHGKKGTVASRRIIISKVGKVAGKKIVDVLGKKYKDRRGGYTRITKMPRRQSDGSKLAKIELV